MIRKQGITVTMLTVTLIVLAILGTTITVSVHSTINHSRLTTWANELSNIQSIVNEELKLNSRVPTLSDIVLDVSMFTQEEIDEQFNGETLTGNKTITLRVLDLGTLKITDTIYGNLETETDIYAISNTNKVYYVKGIKVSGKTYFTLTDDLKNMYELDAANEKIDTVVYKPNITGFTNNPIVVTIYIPKDYTNVQITTTNNTIQVGTPVLNNGKYEYVVNTNNMLGNYTITTTYLKAGVNETSTYEVNTFDNTKPVINEIDKDTDVVSNESLTYIKNINATDENGIKYFKYESAKIEEDDAKEYFATKGSNVVNGRIIINKSIYTLYTEDNAGNFSVKYVYSMDYIDSSWE